MRATWSKLTALALLWLLQALQVHAQALKGGACTEEEKGQLQCGKIGGNDGARFRSEGILRCDGQKWVETENCEAKGKHCSLRHDIQHGFVDQQCVKGLPEEMNPNGGKSKLCDPDSGDRRISTCDPHTESIWRCESTKDGTHEWVWSSYCFLGQKCTVKDALNAGQKGERYKVASCMTEGAKRVAGGTIQRSGRAVTVK